MAPEERAEVEDLPSFRPLPGRKSCARDLDRTVEFLPQPREFDPSYLGLLEDPFASVAEPGFLHTAIELRATYRALLEALHSRGGLFLLTGFAGMGKSLLTVRLVQEWAANGHAVLSAPGGDPDPAAAPAARLSRFLGVAQAPAETLGWVAAIRNGIAAIATRKPLLVIDEAQRLDLSSFALLRLLLRYVEPLRVLLVGRPELGATLSPHLQAELAAAIVMHGTVQPMTDDAIASLIWHRLRRAGCRRNDLFAETAIAAVVAHARGSPERAVRLCARSLRHAAAQAATTVTESMVREVVAQPAPDAPALARIEAATGTATVPAWYERQPPTPAAMPSGAKARVPLAASVAIGALATAAAVAVIVALPKRLTGPDFALARIETPSAAITGAEGGAPISLAKEFARPRPVIPATFASAILVSAPIDTPVAARPAAPRDGEAVSGATAFPPEPVPSAATAAPAANETSTPDIAVAPAMASGSITLATMPADAATADQSGTGIGTEAPRPEPAPPDESPRPESGAAALDTSSEASPNEPPNVAAEADEARPQTLPAVSPPARPSPATVEASTIAETPILSAPPVSDDDAAERTAMIRLLMARGGRQIARGQLVAPANDNALDTYRELLLFAPEADAAAMLLGHIRARYREDAQAAAELGNADEAQQLEGLAHGPLENDMSAVPAPPPSPEMPAESTVEPVSITTPAPERPELAPAAVPAAAPRPEMAADTVVEPVAVTTAIPERRELAPPAPASTAAPTLAKLRPPAPRQPELIAALMRRGSDMLAIGDISAARLLFERAANAGEAKAATAVAKTYDPAFLDALEARGVKPQPERAAEWYQRALDAGDAEAGAWLSKLRDAAPR